MPDADTPNIVLTNLFFLKLSNPQMYGRYTKDLGEYAKNEARKLKMLERRRKKEDKARDKVDHIRYIRVYIIRVSLIRRTEILASWYWGVIWRH